MLEMSACQMPRSWHEIGNFKFSILNFQVFNIEIFFQDNERPRKNDPHRSRGETIAISVNNEMAKALGIFELSTIESMKPKLQHSMSKVYVNEVAIVGYANEIRQIFDLQEIHLIPVFTMYQEMDHFSRLCQSDQRLQIKSTIADLYMFSIIVYFNIEKDAIICAANLTNSNCILVELTLLYGTVDHPMAHLHRTLAHMVRDIIEEDLFLRDLVKYKEISIQSNT